MHEIDEKKKKNYKLLRIILQSIILLIVIGLIIYLTIKMYPYFDKINKDEVYKEEFIENIRSYGFLSFFIILGLQILQTIFMIIPSGPIVMISGVLFNPVIAIIVCLIGQTIGGVSVYYLVRLLGYRFIALFIDPNKIKNSKLLGNEVRTRVLMFGYLLIPALPKDIIAFIVPFTKVKVKDFIIINLIARTPMTIVTVLIGSSIINGSYTLAIVLGYISLILAILCFIFNGKIVRYLENRVKRKESYEAK
ncbi:MAG: TVP38/TMEM64 family protein [Acholeplasmatales bacterium]|nr:TVP38/TMEM64 family protein [Acholeplasmatales bacterium]